MKKSTPTDSKGKDKSMVAALDHVRELRELTSCGVMDCKKALEEAKGDLNKAKQILQERGAQLAAKKEGREVNQGRVESYVHMGAKIGVLVEVNCETDFVAHNEDFCRFTKDVAMQIAASAPKYIRKEDVPANVLQAQPDPEAFMKKNCLLEQPFIKDLKITMRDYLNTVIGKIGENIVIGRFVRFQVGASPEKES